MKEQNKKGICLRIQDVSTGKRKGWISQCFLALSAYLALGNLFLELTGFYALCSLKIFLSVGIILCVLYTISWRYQKQSMYYLAMLVLLIFVAVFRRQIMEGVFLFWNRFADTWTTNTGWVVHELESQLSEQNQSLYLALFSALMGILCAAVCCMLSFYAPGMLAVILPFLLILGMIVFQSKVSSLGMLFVLLASVLLLHGSGKEKKSGLPILTDWILCGILICILLPLVSRPEVLTWGSEVKHKTHRMIHSCKYETEYTTLPEGDFSNAIIEKINTLPALAVTMTQPEAMYLRGFTGSNFEDNVWTLQDTKRLADNKELLYWLNLNEFHPAAQFHAALTGSSVQQNVITVENLGACNEYLYVPFSLQKGAYLIAEDLNTDCIASLDGQRTYTYAAVSGGEKIISKLVVQLQTSATEAEARYLRAETAYRDFVYANYLDISEEMIALLKNSWDDVLDDLGYTGKLSMQQSKKCTLTFLERCFPVDGTQPDFALPLENMEGTNYQYATVAVLTLRYFGIPARYAEGFQITDEMIAGAGIGTPIIVDSGSAKAWAEVYLEGVGWVPVNLVPGLGAVDGSGGSSYYAPPEQVEADKNQESPEMAPETENLTQWNTCLSKLIYWLIFAVLFLIIVLVARRSVLLFKRQRRFQSSNINDGVAWIFSDSILLLKQMGYDRRGGSVMVLYEQLKTHFGEKYGQQMKKVTELNGMALFSNHTLNQEDWMEVMNFHNQTLMYLKENTGIGKRLWLKWICCMY